MSVSQRGQWNFIPSTFKGLPLRGGANHFWYASRGLESGSTNLSPPIPSSFAPNIIFAPAHPFAPFLCPAYPHSSNRSPMIGLQTLRAEIRPTLRLAIPLVLAELGWMSMAVVDTMMVGRLPSSAVAISAVSLGGILVHVLSFFGGGPLIDFVTLVWWTVGAGQRQDSLRSLLHGVFHSLARAP